MTRVRELGVLLPGETGEANAITDVDGVEVGYTTLMAGDDVRTGVTAILPRGRAGFATPCAAATHALNGNGEMTGTAWLAETGSLTLPVLITNTHAVGPCHRGVIDWAIREQPDAVAEWLLPVVAETWDGQLNDVNAPTVRSEHAIAAIDSARPGPIKEGSVGGGTGMICYGFKGGTGTASRVVAYGDDSYTVGALVQANFGARPELTVAGVHIGPELADVPLPGGPAAAPPGAGSVIVVVGTDAPLLPGQCAALARRVPLGLARTGTTGSHFSGDLFLAFSTGNPGALTSGFPVTAEAVYESLRFVPWGRLNPFLEAVAHAVEEAVLNALVANETMVGRNGLSCPALPVERLVPLLRSPAPRIH